MIIAKPDPEFVKETVDAIIEVNAKPISLVKSANRVLCPTCAGQDPFCPLCKGNEYIETIDKILVYGLVRWKTLEKKKFKPDGQYVEGDCTVTLSYSEELEDILYTVKSVEVDQRACVIDHWNIKGVPPNRIYLILKEDENSKGVRL